ncbi:MAG: alcohol dehydrogenase [Phycisphaerae bacterium]|nr:MAG: alcohol dehydrogenase [Phycisphaerae bacterium]
MLGRWVPSVNWSALGSLRYTDILKPPLPSDDWVLLKTRLGGICGTDMAMLTQRTHPANIVRSLTSFPIALGHENVALVDEVGSGVGKWKVGDRVVCEPSLSCVPRGVDPPCEPCAAGRFSLCESYIGRGHFDKGTMIGLNNFTSGSWSPYFVAHKSQLYRVPDTLSDEQAVLVDPLACSLHAVLRRVPTDDERVLIIGAGIIGIGVLKCLRAMGSRAQVTIIARSKRQVESLRQCGANEVVIAPRRLSRAVLFDQVADNLGTQRVAGRFGNQLMIGGADTVFDCVGTGETLANAMKFCKSRGTVVAAGTSHIALVDTTALWFNELTILGAYGRQFENVNGKRRHTYEMVFDLIGQGKLKIDDLGVKTFAPSQYKEAFSAVGQRSGSGVCKIAFHHGI